MSIDTNMRNMRVRRRCSRVQGRPKSEPTTVSQQTVLNATGRHRESRVNDYTGPTFTSP